jgi:hypothetical protein
MLKITMKWRRERDDHERRLSIDDNAKGITILTSRGTSNKRQGNVQQRAHGGPGSNVTGFKSPM